MDAHKHKPALVKLLEHGLELTDGGHILVVPGVGIVVVKGTVGIDDQRMEKDMRDVRRIRPAHGLLFRRLITRLCLSQYRLLLPIASELLQLGNGSVIVIACGQRIGLLHERGGTHLGCFRRRLGLTRLTDRLGRRARGLLARFFDRRHEPDHKDQKQNQDHRQQRVELAVVILFLAVRGAAIALLRSLCTLLRAAIALRLLAAGMGLLMVLVAVVCLSLLVRMRPRSGLLLTALRTAVALRFLPRKLPFLILRCLLCSLALLGTLLALGEEFFHVPFVIVIKIICLASALVILVIRWAIIRHLCLGLLSVSILGMTLVSVGKFRLFL